MAESPGSEGHEADEGLGLPPRVLTGLVRGVVTAVQGRKGLHQ
jgi:hypothetical protein